MFNLNNINSWIKILFILKDLEDLRQLHSLDILFAESIMTDLVNLS